MKFLLNLHVVTERSYAARQRLARMNGGINVLKETLSSHENIFYELFPLKLCFGLNSFINMRSMKKGNSDSQVISLTFC